MKDPLAKHEVALIKAGQACDLFEEALNEAPDRRHILNRLQNLLRKYSAEIVVKGLHAQ